MDLTAVYITAEAAPGAFRKATMRRLKAALEDIPLVIIKKDPSVERSQASIYHQTLKGAKIADTKYIAICEDDVLYSPEHFKFRPQDGHWGYNMNSWNLFTWGEPMFTQKPGGRRNLNGLICERELFIEHLNERFALWPDDSKIDINIFGEPGKYDRQLGTTPYPSQYFHTNPPNVVFSHQANLQFEGLGTRKRVGEIRALKIPYWGWADELIGEYK